MASPKERARWERWYDQVKARMDRQANSITRLVLINTEAMAALAQIAKDGDITRIEQARERAQEAIDRMKEAATAVREEVEDTEAATPVSDPRSSQ